MSLIAFNVVLIDNILAIFQLAVLFHGTNESIDWSKIESSDIIDNGS